MANLKDLKNKIVSTKKTKAATGAMKMVSAAKLRRSQENILNARPYARRLMDVIQRIATYSDHPFLKRHDSRSQLLLVVLTSDRGLCGGFNNSICKYTETFLQKEKSNYDKIDLIFIGRKGADYFKRRGVTSQKNILNLARNINYHLAADISEDILKAYSSEKYSEVRMIYNEFKSALAQDIVDERLIPVLTEDKETSSNDHFFSDFIIEPRIEKILDTLLRKHFAIQVYRCLQESVTSEHGARMSAMENASKNAQEMISNLSLEYNKARQAKITTELIEITSGANALH